MLADVDRAVNALAAVRAAVLVAERDAGTWQGSGDRSIVGWWARTSRSGQRAAAAQMRQAEHLDAAPAATAAVAEGRIGLEHAAVIGRVVSAGSPAQREAAASPAGQQHLLRMAESHDAGTFATAAARWAATVDPAALQRDHDAQRAERFLHLTTTPQGTVIRGRVDSMAGHRLTLALEALSPRPGADDDRDPGQRCADALDAMAVRTLADGKPGAHAPQQVTLILSEQTWLAARAERDRRRAKAGGANGAAGAGADGEATGTERTGTAEASAGVTSYPPATLEDGTPVPVSELASAMCDGEISRLVVDADGVPLDAGRARRLFTAPQRRAIAARDRGCGWPQCHAPARWCEVHHVQWWDRDAGPTSVDNGVLLCSFHHHEVHRRDLVITPILAPPGDRASTSDASDTITRVTYRFVDSAGRVVAPRGPAPAATTGATGAVPAARAAVPTKAAVATAVRAACAQGPPGTSPPARPPAHLEPRSAPTPTATPTPTQDLPRLRAAADARDVPELDWVDDPVTGMRVPAYFVDP
ncbi:HNH endonuclease [Cellulomonas aerilata]|uniref:HNH endonuclease n=1 Tax=Cellulomonas aerilata TaxID=515326 RepID=UPI001649C889|nr:DUF222 domain-containing protein [Cellulomonas aerilata]